MSDAATRIESAIGARLEMPLGKLALALAVALGDYACGRLGYAMVVHPAGVVVLWPSAGFALAVLIMVDRRNWGLVVASAAVGSVIADFHGHATLARAVVAAGANLTESVAAAAVVTTLAGPRITLGRLREVMVFVLGAVVLSNAATSLVGALVEIQPSTMSYFTGWVVWWTGDGMGMLLVAPVILTWAGVARSDFRLSWPRALEGVLVRLGIGIVTYTTVSQTVTGPLAFDHNAYVVFPLLLWLAARFGPSGAATGTLMLGGVTIWLSSRGMGTFGAEGTDRLLQVRAIYSFLGLSCLSAMVPAAIIAELRTTEEDLRQSERRFREMAEQIDEVFWLSSADNGSLLYVSPAFAKVWGRDDAVLRSGRWDWLATIHPDDRERVRTAAVRRQATGEYAEEYRITRPDGSVRWISDRAFPIRDETGGIYRIAGVAQDITARHQATEDLRMLALRLESAQEAVRAAIAREVHDDLGQMLTVLRMDASRLGRLTSGTPEIAGLVKQMTETIDATLETARSVARDLHPTALEDLGLAAAIEMHVERVARRANLESTLELSESDGRIDRSVARAAFRILQESLTNVVRHAESSAVTVRLAVSNSELELEVTDNGRGIAEDALSRQGSFGLLSMRERAAAFEGSVTVMAAHPRGTRVLLRMPITRPGPQGGVE